MQKTEKAEKLRLRLRYSLVVN